MPKRSRKPSDLNALAASIVDDSTSEVPRATTSPDKDSAAVELGRRGGLKGGKARANSLSAEERSALAQKAARARWDRESVDG